MRPTIHLPNNNASRRSGFQPRSGKSSLFLRLPISMLVVLFFLLQLLFGCVSLVYYEGDYHGKVIDAETLQPIEGAVVLGVWSLEYGTVGGPVHEYYDARETLTDQHGEFSIKGMGPRAVTHLQKMRLTVFKAGYEEVAQTKWEYLKTDSSYNDIVKWEGDKAIIMLKKLSLEERRKRLDPSPTGVPMEKHNMLLEEIKRDRFWIK